MSNAEISSSNQKPSTHKISQNDQIDRRRLILLNLPHDLIREYLELYIDHLSGETEIEKIDYSNLDDTTIMVTFKTELGKFFLSTSRLRMNRILLVRG